MLARSSRAGACSRRATAASAAMAGALLPESLLPERRGGRSDCPEERLACTEGKGHSCSADSEMVSGAKRSGHNDLSTLPPGLLHTALQQPPQRAEIAALVNGAVLQAGHAPWRRCLLLCGSSLLVPGSQARTLRNRMGGANLRRGVCCLPTISKSRRRPSNRNAAVNKRS